jgi:hypothetical protein
MIEVIFRLILALVRTEDAEALVRTDRADLTVETAREHIAAARIAAAYHQVDPSLLLSIAWHESRYKVDAVGKEIGGLVSCGPMTPVPIKKCEKKGIVDGYLDGAGHLREWINTSQSLHVALLGYAGGYRLIEACSNGPVIRKNGRRDDLCKTPDVFIWRRNWIRDEIEGRKIRRS